MTDPTIRKLANIRDRFVSELSLRRADLEILTYGLEDLADRPARLERACRIAHRIVGVAGTLGFPKLGQVAGRAETDLARAASPDGAQMLNADAKHAVEALCEAITQVQIEGQDCDEVNWRVPKSSTDLPD